MRRPVTFLVAVALVLVACGDAATISTSVATPTTGPPGTTAATTATAPPAAAATTTSEPPAEILLPAPGTTHFAIVNVTIIAATGAKPLADGVVVVSDGLISAVGAATEALIPADAAIIDAAGGFVLPGLVDTHTHLLNELRIDGTAFDGIRAQIHLESPLQTGLTTFRDLGSAFGDELGMGELRTALATHDEPVPTVVVAGPLIAHTASEALRLFPEQAIGVDDPTSGDAAVRGLVEGGVDQIKIFIDDELRGVSTTSLDAETVAAIAAAAHEEGVWVTAHVSTEDEAWLALDNGADGLAHWPSREPMSDELIAAIAAGGVPVATTFEVSPAAAGDLRRMLDAGVMVVMGTDAPGGGSSVATWRELDAMVQAGATPMEAIVASTRYAAAVVGLGAETGTIEVGKQADLIIVGNDPTEDVRALSEVLVVVKGGVIVS